MPLSVGLTFTMARAQIVYNDTFAGTKNIVAKGSTVVVEALTSTTVSLRIEEGMYEVAKGGCYALSMAARYGDNDGWQWDSKKNTYRRDVKGANLYAKVPPSVALRLLRNAI